MSDWIWVDSAGKSHGKELPSYAKLPAKKYYESGYLEMTLATSERRQERIEALEREGAAHAAVIAALTKKREQLERAQMISPELRERIKVMVEYPGRLPLWGEANWIGLLKDILAATTPEGE